MKTLNATYAVIHLSVLLHSIICSVLIAQIRVIVHSVTDSYQRNKKKKEKNSLKRPQSSQQETKSVSWIQIMFH